MGEKTGIQRGIEGGNMTPEKVLEIWKEAKELASIGVFTPTGLEHHRQVMRLCVEACEDKIQMIEWMMEDRSATAEEVEERKVWQSLLTKIKEEK